jgi:DNA-binding NarL/FixJ family response regulator
MPIRVLLADDHQMLRDGLRALLDKETDFEVVGEAETGEAALQLSEKLNPDVVVMDISMPGMNGIEAALKFRQQRPKTKILALSMHADRRFVAEMLTAGAAGYLLKGSAGEELVQAIRTVVSGKTYLCPLIARSVADDYARGVTTNGSARSILTPRELEIVQHMVEGKTTKEIAYTLNVSVKTVESHRARIFEKLGFSSIAELTKYALREGITSLEF